MDSLPSDDEYARFRTELIRRVLAGEKPADIADRLEIEMDRFPQISREEIHRYRHMGDDQ